MVDPVVDYLNGRGHRILRARDVGLARASDADLVEYALANTLVLVTFDGHLRDSSLRAGCPCVHFRPREITARKRISDCYDETTRLLRAGVRLVTIDSKGNVVSGIIKRQPRQAEPRARVGA